MKSGFKYVTGYRDQHQKVRWRFRKKGHDDAYIKNPVGSKAFLKEYASLLAQEPRSIGEDRIKPGSVSDVICRYYADTSFLDLRPATKIVYRGVLERFRATFGNDHIREFDADSIARLMTKMRDRPHAAARLRKLLAQLMTRNTIASGRIRLDQSKTSNAVDVPVVEPLQEALDAGPLGVDLLLEAKTGAAFTPKGFYGMLKRACRAAGLDHCSPHGLRKSAARRCREAGCSDEEGMAITGHKSVKEYRRYAGEDACGDRADAAMAKVMANRAARLASGRQEGVENAA